MGHRVITIGRQYGSGGHEIGEKLAAKLGFSFYDKNLIDLAADHSGIRKDLLEEADEKATGRFLYPVLDEDSLRRGRGLSPNDALFYSQFDLLQEIAQKEDCVIVGRCSDYILRDQHLRLLNVFIHAPIEARIMRICERCKVDEKQAAALIRKTDKQRKYYYNYYTDRNWGDMENYHLTIDSGKWGVNGVVSMLAKIVPSI